MTPCNDEPALRLSLGLARAHAAMQALLDERLGRWHGLSLADFRLLDALASAPQGCLPTQPLAAALHLAPSALVRQLMPLQKTGLITREDGAVQLRPAGRNLHAEATQTLGASSHSVCGAAGLEDGACEALRVQLDALAHAAARIGSGAWAR